MKFFKLSQKWEVPLKTFLEALEAAGDHVRFHPHEFDAKTVKALARHKGKDYYCVLVREARVLGYGMLRGWDEGYAVPSLGIAVHPDLQGKGLGKAIMEHLHAEARKHGATKVRLRVKKDNERALGLYRELGYDFRPHQDGYLEGLLKL